MDGTGISSPEIGLQFLDHPFEESIDDPALPRDQILHARGVDRPVLPLVPDEIRPFNRESAVPTVLGSSSIPDAISPRVKALSS